ncbi:MAG: DUF11 domain-containing protein [Anaerolineales bacterium]|nr:MAG: DUF11 domain-containing protein [Anaerolineales bacterium]
MMKRVAVSVGAAGAAVVLLVLMVAVVDAAPAIPTVSFSKSASSSSLQVGDVFSFTLVFSNTSSDPLTARVMDPNPAPSCLEIISTTVTGGGVYSPTIDGVVWEGMVGVGAGPYFVSFDVEVTGIPTATLPTGQVTNTAQLVDLYTPSSLPTAWAEETITIEPIKVFLPLVMRSYSD